MNQLLFYSGIQSSLVSGSAANLAHQVNGKTAAKMDNQQTYYPANTAINNNSSNTIAKSSNENNTNALLNNHFAEASKGPFFNGNFTSLAQTQVPQFSAQWSPAGDVFMKRNTSHKDVLSQLNTAKSSLFQF